MLSKLSALSYFSVGVALFSPPSIAIELLQGTSCHGDQCFTYKSEIDTQQFLSTPKWSDLSKPSPLSLSQVAIKANEYAAKTFSTVPQPPKIVRIDLRRHVFSAFGESGPDLSDNWYYVVSFGLPFKMMSDVPSEVAILMDGTVVKPIKQKQKL